MSSPDGYFGIQTASSRTGDFNAIAFIVRAILAGRAHMALVQVINVTPGTPQSTGTVDVQPMVNQIDADGNAMPHGVINGIPWVTLQAGPNAVLLQPEVGDRGLCVFADRDISSVKATRAIANPGSLRQADYADGVYLGGLLNDDPTQWIKMDANGIVLHSPTLIRLEAPTIRMVADTLIALSAPTVDVDTQTMTIDATTGMTVTTPTFNVVGAASVSGLTSLNGGFASLPRAGGAASTISGNVDLTGNLTSTGTVTNNGKNIGSTHTHSGVQPGGGNSGPPV